MKIYRLLTLVLFAFFALISCEKNEDKPKNDSINLEVVDFFKLSDYEIIDSISNLLDIKNFTYDGVVDKWEQDHGVAGYSWIKEGNKYVNSDGQSIILWTDSLENLSTITYLHYRHSISDSWNNDEIEVKNYIDNIFSGLGLIQKLNEEYLINESSGGNIKWYDLMCNQTIHSDTITHPIFNAEIEGDTCKINYLMIPIWYENLNDINSEISLNDLMEKASDFFIFNYDGISDSFANKGYWVVYNKLCYVFDAKKPGERGTYRVFIDVQTGEIVHNTVI